MNSDEENMEVCRLCENKVLRSLFDFHCNYCLIGNKCAIKIASLDEKLSEVKDILRTILKETASRTG